MFGIGDRRQSRGGPERLGELGDSRSRAPYHPSRKSIEPGEAMALSTAAPSAATWARCAVGGAVDLLPESGFDLEAHVKQIERGCMAER